MLSPCSGSWGVVMVPGSLVDDWRSAWRWWSVRIAALLAMAPELFEQMPGFKQYLPESIFHHMMSGLALLIIFGRVTSQTKSEPKPEGNNHGNQ